jgi:hypothetical protein
MPNSRLTNAVQGLDPGSRALLDLSLRRRIPDDEIAHLLRITPADVARRRGAAIRNLGAELEIARPDQLAAMLAAIAELPPEAWGVPGRRPAASPPPPAREVRVRSSRALRRIAIAGVPLTALGATVAMMLVAGGDETPMEQGQLPPGSGHARKPPASVPLEGGALAQRRDGRDGEGTAAAAGAGANQPELLASLRVGGEVERATPRRVEARERPAPRRERRESTERGPAAPPSGGAPPANAEPAPAANTSPPPAETPAKTVEVRTRKHGKGRSGGLDGGRQKGANREGPKGFGDSKPGKGPKLFGDDKPGKGPKPDHGGKDLELPDGPPPAPGHLPKAPKIGKRRR